MILRSSRLQEGTHLNEENGKFSLTRIENIDPVLKANYEDRKDRSNGWNKDRTMRRIGRIPFNEWNEKIKIYPELILGDRELKEKTLNRLLRGEWKQFCTVEKGI